MRRHNGQPPNAACVFPPRRTEGLSNRIPFSFVRPCFSRPAPLLLRRPKRPALACPPHREDCLPPRREESWCAGERQKARRINAFRRKKRIGGPLTNKNAGRSRTRIWRAKAPTAICRLESSSGNPRTRNASAPETPSSTTPKAAPRCLASKQSSPPGRFHWEPLRRRASPTGLGFAPGPRQRCRNSTTTRAQVWRRLLSYVCAPARGSTPPLPMQRSATPSPTRRRFTPAPGLKTTTAFRPSPICSAALRRRRSVYGYLVRHPHAKADGRRFGAA